MIIKTISLWQPWASLMAMGFKSVETRDWPTSYRGPIAIHATKSMPSEARSFCSDEAVVSALWPDLLPVQIWKDHWYDSLEARIKQLPRGAIVAVGILAGCKQFTPTQHTAPDGTYERAFGNYAPGRWGWWIRGIRPLAEPLEAKGMQGLWNWNAPDNLEALLAVPYQDRSLDAVPQRRTIIAEPLRGNNGSSGDEFFIPW